jgi:hypothetical protein
MAFLIDNILTLEIEKDDDTKYLTHLHDNKIDWELHTTEIEDTQIIGLDIDDNEITLQDFIISSCYINGLDDIQIITDYDNDETILLRVELVEYSENHIICNYLQRI